MEGNDSAHLKRIKYWEPKKYGEIVKKLFQKCLSGKYKKDLIKSTLMEYIISFQSLIMYLNFQMYMEILLCFRSSDYVRKNFKIITKDIILTIGSFGMLKEL